jgi:hypothetical protein
MRLHSLLPAIAASTLATLINTVDAQESSPRPTVVEGSIGAGTQVPGRGDEGIGPFVSATLRLAPGRSGQAFLLGVGYGIVFTDGWTSPEGVQYDFAPEAVMLHLGYEWPFGAPRRFAIDAQWNPALSRVRRWGRQPPWVSGSSTWERTANAGSLGLRYALSGSRGPVVAVSLRTYLSMTPFMFVGGINPWHVVGLTLRPR